MEFRIALNQPIHFWLEGEKIAPQQIVLTGPKVLIAISSSSIDSYDLHQMTSSEFVVINSVKILQKHHTILIDQSIQSEF